MIWVGKLDEGQAAVGYSQCLVRLSYGELIINIIQNGLVGQLLLKDKENMMFFSKGF